VDVVLSLPAELHVRIGAVHLQGDAMLRTHDEVCRAGHAGARTRGNQPQGLVQALTATNNINTYTNVIISSELS